MTTKIKVAALVAVVSAAAFWWMHSSTEAGNKPVPQKQVSSPEPQPVPAPKEPDAAIPPEGKNIYAFLAESQGKEPPPPLPAQWTADSKKTPSDKEKR